MKKALLVALCFVMVFSFAACESKQGKNGLGKLQEYTVGDYKINLPETYQLNDLNAVNAEANCIAMFTDSKEKLPDLWIYEDKCQGTTIKEHILKLDSTWDYSEMSFYSVNDINLARTVYDEEWYGQNLINEHYYRIENGATVLSFDFAYSKTDDTKLAHDYVVAIAEALGF